MFSMTITVLFALSLLLGVGGGDVHPSMNSSSTHNIASAMVPVSSFELSLPLGNQLDVFTQFSGTHQNRKSIGDEESTFEVKIIATFTSSGKLISVRPVRDIPSEHGAMVLFDDRLSKIKVLFDRKRLYSKYLFHLFLIVTCMVYITFNRRQKEKPRRPKRVHIYLRRLL